MAFIVKKLSCLVAGLGQKTKGTLRNVAVEDVASGPFFSIPAEKHVDSPR